MLPAYPSVQNSTYPGAIPAAPFGTPAYATFPFNKWSVVTIENIRMIIKRRILT